MEPDAPASRHQRGDDGGGNKHDTWMFKVNNTTATLAALKRTRSIGRPGRSLLGEPLAKWPHRVWTLSDSAAVKTFPPGSSSTDINGGGGPSVEQLHPPHRASTFLEGNRTPFGIFVRGRRLRGYGGGGGGSASENINNLGGTDASSRSVKRNEMIERVSGWGFQIKSA